MKLNWKYFRSELRDYIGVFFGASLAALAMVWLLIPNKIAAGGVSGLAVVFYHLWNWPVAFSMLLMNVPLFLACLWFLGSRYGMKTLFGAGSISIMIEFWSRVVELPALTDDPVLAALYGGALAGLGMGLAFRYRGSTGGTDLAAQLLYRFSGLPVGNALMLFDSLVVVFAGFAFHSVELSLYAIIAIGVTGKAIDWVLEGWNHAKAAVIISNQASSIGERILADLQRGATSWQGQGLYSGENKQMILCVISRAEVIRLKELVHQLDPAAFIIIADIHEVLGEGFLQIES